LAKTSELRALVSLLADDDPRITDMVWDRLSRMGPDALPALRAACEDADPVLRTRARHALDVLSFEQLEEDLQAIADSDDLEFPLERAFHTLDQVEYPGISLDRIRHPLDALAERIRPRFAGRRRPADRLQEMHTVLHREMRFVPVARVAADAQAFVLHRVLERRHGAPVLLAAVYLLVARRLGLPLVGVSLPSHILLRLHDNEQEIYLDPARGGGPFGRRECVQTYLRDYFPREAYVHAASGRDLAVRTVRGLMLLYARTQDRARARRLGRLLDILQAREQAR
jgi:regulator of sirC expression with transglutaminase-like and TPR domain